MSLVVCFLQGLLLGLKISGGIDWPWLLVFAPIGIPALIFLIRQIKWAIDVNYHTKKFK